jgi:hypothetical protein
VPVVAAVSGKPVSCLWLAFCYNEYPVGCEHFPPLSAKPVRSPPLFFPRKAFDLPPKTGGN